MSNMAYCRFENTYRDLLKCQEAIDDGEKLSVSEAAYKEKLIAICKEIVEEHSP